VDSDSNLPKRISTNKGAVADTRMAMSRNWPVVLYEEYVSVSRFALRYSNDVLYILYFI